MRYNVATGVQHAKLNVKKYVIGTTAVVMMAGGAAIPAMAAGGPTLTGQPGPGCFGLWRAGSVQYINQNGLGPAGQNYFADRAADNSTMNADARAYCATL